MVATWLSALTPEERERFHTLRSAFNTELAAREMESDRLDENRAIDAELPRDERRPKEEENCAKRFEKMKQARQHR